MLFPPTERIRFGKLEIRTNLIFFATGNILSWWRVQKKF